MDMREWAKREIELACEQERGGIENSDEWNYSCACYESAYKAFMSLTEDGHSGFSIGITKSILNRLIDGKPLTPIVDTPDIWTEINFGKNDCTSYQCKRMSSLFKDVYKDGTVKYNDINRYCCVNEDEPNICGWRSSFVDGIINEIYPISMPYKPSTKPIVVHCIEGLSDPRNGDYDSLGILYIVEPDNTRKEINRFFKEGCSSWIEIDKGEFYDRIGGKDNVTC